MKLFAIVLSYLLYALQEKETSAFPKTLNLGKELDHIKYDVLEYFGNEEKTSTIKFEEFRRDNVNIDVLEISKDFNPEVILTTPELIARNGYSAESHTVTTEDGYLLTLHRIPRGKSFPTRFVASKTVLLHHGLLSSSADWVINGPDHSLAYILADAGYDVWMGNARGNTYSRAHVSLDPDSLKFWNFTWNEIGNRDLPAVINYIDSLKGKKDKIHYVGHSMGTTVLFVLLSSRPEYNRRIRAGYALAPVAYMSDIKTPFKLLAPKANFIQDFLAKFGIYNLLPQNYLFRWLVKNLCERNEQHMKFCQNFLFLFFGFDSPQFTLSRLPVYLSHIPAGSSIKAFVHYAQLIQKKTKFQQFDYGSDGNMKQYGSEIPPEYALDKITTPISLFVSRNDWLSGLVDAEKLYHKLKNHGELYIVPSKEFNHIDFLWAKDVTKLVYKKLLNLLSNDNS